MTPEPSPHQQAPIPPTSPPALGYAPIAGPVTAGQRGSARTRRRWLRAATVTGTLVAMPAAGAGTGLQPRAAAAPTATSDVEGADLALAVRSIREAFRARVIASVEGVAIVNPADDATLIGFHEAAGSTLELRPARAVAEDLHPGGHGALPRGPAHVEGQPDLVVLPPRGRAVGATTAIDVAVPPGHVVTSPVTGTVVSVDHYSLYGTTPDTFVTIVPEGRPDLAVKVMHVADVRVVPGERVVAGRTPVAGSANQLPFGSQIDRLTEQRGAGVGPHVHLEVLRAG